MNPILTLAFLACWSPSGWLDVTECVAETFAVQSVAQCWRVAAHRRVVLIRDGATLFKVNCRPNTGI